MNTAESLSNASPGTSKLLTRILVPVDFSEGSRKAVRYAGALAAPFGATVYVACIVAPVVALEALSALGLAESDEVAATKCEAKLRAMARDEWGESIQAEFEVVVGDPLNEIIRLARELEADLIVMSTHGYTGLKHALLGSTAEHVVRQSPCPVLVVRERERDFVAPNSAVAEPVNRQHQPDSIP
ncbi:MAG: universal stress protein [Verrucomicrobia subdivision 3 bacterium]|nr:universal stress protein [Limisphaerales bacterium]